MPRPYLLLGVTYEGELTITKSRPIKTYGNSLQEERNHSKFLRQAQGCKDKECTFVRLICSDTRPDFWEDMVDFWNYADNLGLDSGNVYAFYHDGKSRKESQIPSEQLSPATHDDIEEAFQELAGKIAECEREGKTAKLIKLVTDHGSGYHTGSSDSTGPQAYSDGWDGRDERNRKLSSGIYFYRLKTAHGIKGIRKILLLKG